MISFVRILTVMQEFDTKSLNSPTHDSPTMALRKRSRPLVLDSSDDSTFSPEKRSKRTKATQKPARRMLRVKTRIATQGQGNPWDNQPEHHYFFGNTMFPGHIPGDWHIKSRNPTIYTLGDLKKEDITKFVYPIEVQISKGELVEICNREELQEFMESRGIVPLYVDLAADDDGIPGKPNARTWRSEHDAFSTVRKHPVTSSHTSITRRAKKDLNLSNGNPEGLRMLKDPHDNLQPLRMQSKPNQSKNITTSVRTDIRASAVSALQTKFIEKAKLLASIATEALTSDRHSAETYEHVSASMREVQISWEIYHESLSQKFCQTLPQVSHRLLSPIHVDIAELLQRHRIDSLNPASLTANVDLPDATRTSSRSSQADTKSQFISERCVSQPGATQAPRPYTLEPVMISREWHGLEKSGIPRRGRDDAADGFKDEQLALEASGAMGVNGIDGTSNGANPDRFNSRLSGPRRCAFCDESPRKMRRTLCNHHVCFDCYSSALDEAYEAARTYPPCPACGRLITCAPLPCGSTED